MKNAASFADAAKWHEGSRKCYQALHTELNYSMFFAPQPEPSAGRALSPVSKTPHTSLRSRGLHPKIARSCLLHPALFGIFQVAQDVVKKLQQNDSVWRSGRQQNHRLSEIWVEKWKNVDLGDVYV